MENITRAMIMAAGYGNRMRPLTNNVPKPMVKLQGKTLIDHVFDRLLDINMNCTVVNVHYLADELEDHLRTRIQPEIIISDERDILLDTGGGVKKALPFFSDQPFLVHNSDSVWVEGPGSNLRRLLRAWDSDKMDCLMLLALGVTSIGYHGRGDFAMTSKGKLRRRLYNEVVPFVFTGVSIVHPRLFADTPEGAFSMNMLWDRAIETDRLYGIRHDGVWMHVGTPEALQEAEEQLTFLECG